MIECRLAQILVVATALTTLNACATTIDPADTTIEEIIEVEDVSKNDLYTRTNQWAVGAFRRANTAIQYSDRDDGVIAGNVTFHVVGGTNSPAPPMTNTHARAEFSIEVRDGRLRVRFMDFRYADSSNLSPGGALIESVYEDAAMQARSGIDDLRETVTSPDDNW